MNKKNEDIILEINYGEQKISITLNYMINLKELIKKVAKKYNIDKELENKIVFYYKDEDGDIIGIKQIEDIYNISKKQENSDNYLSIIYMEISEEKIIYNEENNINNYELQKQLETIKNDNEKKLKLIEEKIDKMNNKHLEDINKINSFNNLNSNISICNENIIKNEMEKMKNFINDLLNKQKENFIFEIKKEIISEIKKELTNEINNKNEEYFNDIKKNINDIKIDISNIKEKIEKIEINIKNENKKEDIKEDKIKNNNEENNMNNQNKINEFKFGNYYLNALPYENMNKLYTCQNCKNKFLLNECFNPNNKDIFKEHSLKLENLKKDIDNNNNINDINDQEHKNLIDNNNQNIQIIDNFLDKKNLNRQKDDYKDEKDIKDKQQEIKNRNKIINEEVNINKENLEDINQMFNDILHDYFFNENESFKVNKPTEEELDNIKELYNSILENNNYDIEKLKEYQNNYIEKEITQKIKKSTTNHQNAINDKIEKIRQIISEMETNN